MLLTSAKIKGKWLPSEQAGRSMKHLVVDRSKTQRLHLLTTHLGQNQCCGGTNCNKCMQETCQIYMIIEGHSPYEHSHTGHNKMYIYPKFVFNTMSY